MPLLDRIQERAAEVGRRFSVGTRGGGHHSPSPPCNSKRYSLDHQKGSALSSSAAGGGNSSGTSSGAGTVCGSMVAALLSSAASTLTQVGCVGGEMGNKPASSTAQQQQQHNTDNTTTAAQQRQQHAGESGSEDTELEVELPPPMRVMDEPLMAAAANPSTEGASSNSSSSGGGGSGGGTRVAEGASSVAATSGALVMGSTVAAAQQVMGALVGTHNTRGSCASLSANEPSTAHLATELENIVKEKMEQHEGSGDAARGRSANTQDSSAVLSPPASATTTDQQQFQYPSSSGAAASASTVNSPDDASANSLAERELRKFGFVVQELVDTEMSYVRDLSDIVDGYMQEMSSPDANMPDDLQDGKDKIVFGNIAAIYEWHRDFFSKNLEECLKNPEKIGPVFIKSEKKFQIYIKYCQNKPKSEYIVSKFYDYFEEIKQKLGHKLQLSDLLIKPVQRLMKYQLLMRDLYKYSDRGGLTEQTVHLHKALDIMTILPRDADHMMTVGRLQDFHGNIMSQGKLLHYGPLLVSEGDQSAVFRPRELVVFLFEQRIIFSECPKKRTAYVNEEYFCKSHIQMNNLLLDERCDPHDPSKFLLRSTVHRGPPVMHVCQGEDEDDHHTWTSQIRHLLQTQRDFIMAIQAPIAYQKEQTKHLIDGSVAFDPIGLKGRRISTSTAIENFAPAPRLPRRELLPLLPHSDDDATITIVTCNDISTGSSSGGSRIYKIGIGGGNKTASNSGSGNFKVSSGGSNKSNNSGTSSNTNSLSRSNKSNSNNNKSTSSYSNSTFYSPQPQPLGTTNTTTTTAASHGSVGDLHATATSSATEGCGTPAVHHSKSCSTDSTFTSSSFHSISTRARSSSQQYTKSSFSPSHGSSNSPMHTPSPVGSMSGPSSGTTHSPLGSHSSAQSSALTSSSAYHSSAASSSSVSPIPGSPPKNKRTLFEGFRNSLRPKSRLEPDGVVQLHDSRGGSISLAAGTLVQILQGYTSLREDEITVVKGEEVQVVSSSVRGFLIHRPATSSCPAAEGWVPHCVIQPPAPSPVSPQPPAHSSLNLSSHNRSSPSGSNSNSPSNPYPSSNFPGAQYPLTTSTSSSSKKSWIKFRKPSFSKREAKAAAIRREDSLGEKTKHGITVLSVTGPNESGERTLGGERFIGNPGDRNSAGSGSFGSFGDMYSVSNSSDISISDRLSFGESINPGSGGPLGLGGTSDHSNTLTKHHTILDDSTDCVIIGDGGENLLKLSNPLTHVVIQNLGQPFTLSLIICGTGVDTASVSWFGPAGELNNDTRYEQQHLRDGTIALHLDNCGASDLGRYTCVVTCVDNVATRQLRCAATVALASS
uniref:Triple functional domain protein-like n=1 Tax=Hirondellea gigas TaxID=1518452 RepID=A0A6A7G2I5_9CRUS